MSEAGKIFSELLMCGGGVHSILLLYMPIQIWTSQIPQIMSWILAYLCLVTVHLSSTSITYVKNVQTCLVGSKEPLQPETVLL